MVKVEINGQEYEAEEGQTLLEVATENKIEIPTLCYHKSLTRYEACRLCIVEILKDGWSKLAAACTLPVMDGLRVATHSERVLKSRKMTVELLLARCPEEEVLLDLAKEYGIEKLRFKQNDDNCILCGKCVSICAKMGRHAISFMGRGMDRELGSPFMEPTEACIVCGACVDVCPTSRFDIVKVARTSSRDPIPQKLYFEEELATRPNIFTPFPQSVPNVPVIDRENCVHFQTGACGICEEICPPDAIDYDQEDNERILDVGSVIVTPGFEEYDARAVKPYGYGEYPNVVTSIQFERMLSASGPFDGHLKRLSDGKPPKKLAFIQCVGSRDKQAGKPYCSSVCCMYAIKEAMIAMEHSPDLEATIFFMDMRAFGKEFDDYYTRAEKEVGIRFVRNNRISHIIEEPDTKNLTIPYIEKGQMQFEEFDLVVLSVGMLPPEKTKELSETFGIELNQYDFCKSRSMFSPIETSRPGVYVAGAYNAPKDIPDSVSEASGAAGKAASGISAARGQLITKMEYPPEKDVSAEDPRIGVFVCHCGINIGGVVDVPSVAEYAKSLPYVEYAEENLYTCSEDAQKLIKEKIAEHNLNRVVVASCTPRTHQPLFQNTVREAGLNPYLFEMANIRDQCSWVHMKQPTEATEKAADLMKMAVAKAALLEPLENMQIGVQPGGLVIGGGLTGMTSALGLAEQGFEAHLVEKEAELGGLMNRIHYERNHETGEEAADIQAQLDELKAKIEAHDLVHVHTSTTIKDISGYVGNFKTMVEEDGEDRIIDHGVIIVATGGREYKPKEYLYEGHENIITQLELEQQLATAGAPAADTIVMIQCVGSRNEERPYCSRVCCTEAMKNALKIKELNPDASIYVLYRDMRTYGFRELLYEDAASKGVVFMRFADDEAPTVTDDGGLRITVHDQFIDEKIELRPDLIVLSAATIPHESNLDLAKMLKVPLSKDMLFLEAHMKLRPVDFATEGVFLCGLAHSPKFFEECCSQASAAVSRAATILSKAQLEAEGIVSVINEDACTGCNTCVMVCPFNAIEKDETGIARVTEVLCKGCGTCVASCPENAITLAQFTNEQLLAQVRAALAKEGA